MTVENFIETSHWSLLISAIRPRNTYTALAAHLCWEALAYIQYYSAEFRIAIWPTVRFQSENDACIRYSHRQGFIFKIRGRKEKRKLSKKRQFHENRGWGNL